MLSVMAVIKICEMFTKPVIAIKIFLGNIPILNFSSVHLNDLLVAYSWCCTWVDTQVQHQEYLFILVIRFLTVCAVP
jgi:hypothetical protein